MIYVFDIDGTLVNSWMRHSVALKEALDFYSSDGIAFDDDRLVICKRQGMSTSEFLLSEMQLSPELSKCIVKRWTENIENDYYLTLDTLYGDAIDILEMIAKRGNGIYYLTSRQNRQGLLNELDNLAISHYAREIMIVNPLQKYESKGKELLRIKEIEQKPLMVVGDTEVDYEAAVESKCMSYILNRGFRGSDYWDTRYNIKTYSDFSDLFAESEVF